MKHKTTLTKALSLLGLVLALTACTQLLTPPSEPKVSSVPSKAQPAEVVVDALEPVEPLADDLLGSDVGVPEETIDKDALPLDDLAALMQENTASSPAELTALINDFNLNTEPNFLSCAYSSLNSCVQQISMEKAVATKNAAACDNINNVFEASACKNYLWSTLAISQKSVDLCAKIEDEFSKKDCEIQTYTVLSKDDVTQCDNIEDPERQQDCKNTAYLDQAVVEKDVSICENIKQVMLVSSANNDPANPEAFDFVVEVLPEEQNFMKQNCEEMVEMALEVPEDPLAAEATDFLPEDILDEEPLPVPPAEQVPELLVPEPEV